MKRTHVIFILLFALLSCKKENKSTDALTGSWRLIKIYNNSFSDSVPRPPDASGDFIITFQNGETFSGQTFRNTFFDGSYRLSDTNQLSIGRYAATEVMEDLWGNKFNEVAMSCMLQSVSPCTPLKIYIANNRLTITTFYRDNLLFEKL
jgi:hypothetical protein